MTADLEIVTGSLIMPVFFELKRSGIPVQKLVHRSGLPSKILESSVSHLPRAATKRFAHEAVNATGDRLLFYKASSAGIDGLIKKASEPILGRKPLIYERLTRFLELASKVSSAVKFYTRVVDDLLWIIRVSSEKREDENWYFEQYAIGALETVVSRLFGSTIRPVSIRLRSQPRLDLMPSHWRVANVKMHTHQSAIAVPLEVLGTSAEFPEPGHANSKHGVSEEDLIVAVTEYARGSRFGIDHVADAFGMNRRTFQRCLAGRGMTYSFLIEEVKFQKAMNLIKTKGANITEIAIETGYSNPENFTRAFRRRYGVPPTRYRELLRQG